MKRIFDNMKKLTVKTFQTGMRVFVVVALLTAAASAQAQTFTHSLGQMSTSLDAHGMQVTHEYRQVLYVKPGTSIVLHRPDNASFYKYIRWYDYQTDARAANLTIAGGTSTAQGVFFFENTAELAATFSMPAGSTTVRYIACDQSLYNNYTDGSTIKEPTLSQRLVFEIHPAAEMAEQLDQAVGENWLETYHIIAPTSNDIYIGPKYGFRSSATYQNYYYNASNPTLIPVDASFSASASETSTATDWKLTSQPDVDKTYVCTKAYDNNVSGTASQKYTCPNGATITSVSVTVKNTKNKKTSYSVRLNGGSEKTGGLDGGQSTTTVSYTGLNLSSVTVTVSGNNVSVSSITITEHYNVGAETTQEPNSSVCGNWEMRVSQTGDWVSTRTKTDESSATAGMSWTIDGVANTNPTRVSGQYFQVSSNTAGQHEYCLTYNSTNFSERIVVDSTLVIRGAVTTVSTWIGRNWVEQSTTDTRAEVSRTASEPRVNFTGTRGQTYNIAKFIVTYMPKNEVGPVQNMVEGTRLNQTTLITERRFNDTGETFKTSQYGYSTFLLKPVKAEESSYGFYWGTNRSSDVYKCRPTKDEYALINNARELSWYYDDYGVYNSSSALKNHSYAGESSSLPGYFLFVDGSEKPGNVMSLNARANLCPGSKMFFSAYVADLSSTSSAAPILDFTLVGIDGRGREHELTTYTTGAFGVNTTADGTTSGGKWMRILFPFEFGNDIDYVSYKLKIIDKAADGAGNDFAIDDIQIFVQNPPVMPIQASSTGCPNQQGDAHTYAYLRVDYGAVQNQDNKFYYQWHDYAENNIDTIAYLNKMNSKDGFCGRVTVDANPETSGKVYGNIALFDQAVQSVATPRAMYGYILEKCADGETRYVLYIAQPMTLRVGYKYYGYVASSTEELGPQNNCSSSAELLVAAGITFKMGENVISSGETRTVCGSEPGTLQMVYRYVQRDLEGGILGVRELTNVTADWLFGDAAYVDANPEMYFGYSYSEIWSAIDHYRAGDADAEQTRLFNMLVKNGLLTPNTSSIEPNLIGVSGAETVTYTAFPIISSIHVDEDIRCAEPSTFSFKLGDGGANSVSIFINTIESWETLPLYVKMNPRRIRVSANHLQDGDPSLSFNIGLHGAQDQVYICNSAILVSSTDPQASLRLSNNMIGLSFHGGADAQTIDTNTDAVAITGASGLQGGYDYTFRFAKTRGGSYVDVDDCNEFNTYITLRVVPAIVTWEGSEGDAWNNDAFWDSFVPMADTKVILKDEDYIIPNNASAWGEAQRNDSYEAGAASYITYDINYRTFECEDLYVPAGATLVNQHRLTINGIVYYDLPTNAAKWTMCSFPIKGVVSGDMYIPTNEINDKTVNPFRVQTLGQTTGADASGRTTNKVYVSLYNAKDTVYGPSARTVEGTTWTTETNNLNISFSNPGYAVSIGADYTEDKVIRLPKPETEYKYYQYGAWVDQYATAIERPADYGKPSYQPTGADGANGMNITVNNNTASDLFLIGNPTLAALDIEKFIEGNDNLAGAYYVSNMSSLGARKGSIISVVNGHPSVPGDYHILPVGGAALFQAKTSATSLTVNITPDMLVTSTGNTAATAAPRRVQAAPAADEMDEHSIYISARYNPVTSATCFTSYAVLSQGEEASDDVVDGEDAKTVMYDANKMRFAMYTIGGGKGLSVNQTSVDNDIVPLAVYSHTSMKTLYFVFQGNNDYLQEWDLVNLSDNSRTPLYDSIYVAIKTTANNGVLPLDGSVGYVLEHTRKTPSIATDIDETNPASAFGVYGTTGTLFAYSNDDMQDFCIYDASGRVVVAEKNVGRTAQYHLPTGVYMVRANGEIQKAIVK